MTGFAADQVQIAIYNALQADVPLNALVGDRILDQAQEATPYPYITFGASTAVDFSCKDKDGNDATLMIQVWSQAGGQMEAKGVMKAVQDALNHAPLTVTGQTLIDLRCEFYDVSRLVDQDEFYYRGSMRFRILTLENT